MTDDIRAKVAYLQGLAEGLEIDDSSAEGRLLGGVIDVLGDLASQVNTMSEVQEQLSEYVDELDSDLSSL
ncbi:MAG: CD1247 N-terminal domain-containing protein [Mycobacterium leprae]